MAATTQPNDPVFYWHPRPFVLIDRLLTEITDDLHQFILIKPVQGELPEEWVKSRQKQWDVLDALESQQRLHGALLLADIDWQANKIRWMWIKIEKKYFYRIHELHDLECPNCRIPYRMSELAHL
jgi:hypothetical protein